MGKTSAAATNRYQKKAYDRVVTLFPKGYKDTLDEHVKHTGESVGAFIKRAVSEQMERDQLTPGYMHIPDSSSDADGK